MLGDSVDISSQSKIMECFCSIKLDRLDLCRSDDATLSLLVNFEVIDSDRVVCTVRPLPHDREKKVVKNFVQSSQGSPL